LCLIRRTSGFCERSASGSEFRSRNSSSRLGNTEIPQPHRFRWHSVGPRRKRFSNRAIGLFSAPSVPASPLPVDCSFGDESVYLKETELQLLRSASTSSFFFIR